MRQESNYHAFVMEDKTTTTSLVCIEGMDSFECEAMLQLFKKTGFRRVTLFDIPVHKNSVPRDYATTKILYKGSVISKQQMIALMRTKNGFYSFVPEVFSFIFNCFNGSTFDHDHEESKLFMSYISDSEISIFNECSLAEKMDVLITKANIKRYVDVALSFYASEKGTIDVVKEAHRIETETRQKEQATKRLSMIRFKQRKASKLKTRPMFVQARPNTRSAFNNFNENNNSPHFMTRESNHSKKTEVKEIIDHKTTQDIDEINMVCSDDESTEKIGTNPKKKTFHIKDSSIDTANVYKYIDKISKLKDSTESKKILIETRRKNMVKLSFQLHLCGYLDVSTCKFKLPDEVRKKMQSTIIDCFNKDSIETTMTNNALVEIERRKIRKTIGDCIKKIVIGAYDHLRKGLFYTEGVPLGWREDMATSSYSALVSKMKKRCGKVKLWVGYEHQELVAKLRETCIIFADADIKSYTSIYSKVCENILDIFTDQPTDQ